MKPNDQRNFFIALIGICRRPKRITQIRIARCKTRYRKARSFGAYGGTPSFYRKTEFIVFDLQAVERTRIKDGFYKRISGGLLRFNGKFQRYMISFAVDFIAPRVGEVRVDNIALAF